MKRPTEGPAVAGGEAGGDQRRGILIIAGLAVLHAWIVQGYAGLLWGDHGRWLYELTRFASGQTAYRDFGWRNPPVALWLAGGLAHFTGTSFAALSAIATGVWLALVGVYILILRRLAPDMILPIGLPALLFAMAYAMHTGVPLPLGTYTLSSLIGMLLLLVAVWCSLVAADKPNRLAPAIGAGICAALTALCRHELAIAAAALLGAVTVLLWRPHWRTIIAAAAAAGATGVLVLGVAVAQSGFGPVVYMLAGSGRTLEAVASAVPSLERLTIEIAATAVVGFSAVTALWLCLAISDGVAARWATALGVVFLAAGAVHLGMTVAIGTAMLTGGTEPLRTASQEYLAYSLTHGHSLSGAAIGYFDRSIQAHLFPAILPPLLLGAILLGWHAWREPPLRNRVTALAVLCLAMRLRTGFAGAEWYHVLLELPTTILFIRLAAGPEPRTTGRAARSLLGIFVLLGTYAYLSLGVGPFTMSGRHAPVATAAGTVRWSPRLASEFHRVDSLTRAMDPARGRPVFAFGMTGGWAYFLGRHNATPFDEGMTGSRLPVQRILDSLRASTPAPILLDNRFALWPAVSPRSDIFQWEPEPVPSPFAINDRAYFDRLKEGCPAVGGADSTVSIVVYDCAPRAGTPPPAAAPGAPR